MENPYKSPPQKPHIETASTGMRLGATLVRTILFAIVGGFGGLVACVLMLLLIGVVLVIVAPIFEVTSPRGEYIVIGLVGVFVFSGSIVGLFFARRHEKRVATLEKNDEEPLG